jgi:M6 family metalloprotease-like protein
MKKLFAFFLFFSINLLAFGIYLENVPTQLVQPNGEILNLFITGDEFYRTVHDSDGYSIVQGEDGWYYYALYDAANDELVPGEFVVETNRTVSLPMPKRLTISQEKYIEIRRNYYEPTGCNASGFSENSILKDLTNNDAKVTQQINNIVICIGFSDTQGMTRTFSYVDGLFNSNPNNNMRDYFSTMSYNKLDVISHFYPPANENVLRFYQDPYPRNYYRPFNSTNNPDGYKNDTQRTQREHNLLRNAVNWINENWPIPPEINLDVNNDGRCDFISFVVYGPVGGWNDLLWPHKWSLFTYNAYLNGKRVWDYNFELDASSQYFSSNVFCHEGYHVLGAPDLYHYYNYTNIQSVGQWDIMEDSYLTKPQSMSAYMKYKYGKWVESLPIATINKSYEVFPFYTNDGSDSEKPIIHRIPMTDISSQFSVVEYRKKTGTNYDNYIPNQGLLIYRINTNFNGNAEFNGTSVFDEVYLYRPGSSQTTGVYTQGNLPQASFNAANGRTEFNSSTNPKPCRSNGAAENIQDINHILYDNGNDSYTFFYGNPETMEISVNETDLQLEAYSGSTGIVTINSNVVWYINIPEEAADWLAVSKTKGLNDGSVTFSTISHNLNEEPKTTQVIITGNEEIFYINITQKNLETGTIIVSLTANPTSGGTLEGDGFYYIGNNVIVTATVNTGYEFNNWTKSGEVVSLDTAYSFTASEIVELVANFNIRTYTISVSANSTDGGNVTGGGTYEYGENVTVSATANDGYMFINWTKNGVQISSNPNFIFQAIEDLDLVANFALKSYMISVIANPKDGGTVTGEGTYQYGENITVSATANDNYIFLNWTSNSSIISAETSFSFSATENKDLVANFEIIENINHNKQTNKFTVYPNPANNELRISSSEFRVDIIEIFDVYGGKLFSLTASRLPQTVVDISSLSSGIYIVRIIDGKDSYTQRFVKE